MLALKLVYIANIFVAGYIGITSLFSPKISATTIFQNAYQETDIIKLVGCLWLGIAFLSVLGLWKPIVFSPILLLQLIYKGTWLLIVAVPAFRNNEALPIGMSIFFLLWCLVLPFVIPWENWLKLPL